MRRIGRAPAAFVLSLAFAGAPLAADYCALACAAAQIASRADDGSAHAAHHHHAAVAGSTSGSAASGSFRQAPEACGHDHHAAVSIASANDGKVAGVAASAGAALVSTSSIGAPASTNIIHARGSNSPPGRTLLPISSPLRV